MKRKNKAPKKKEKRGRIGIKDIIKADLPAAISSNTTPLLAVGGVVMLIGVMLLIIPSYRRTAPLFLVLGIAISGYSIWVRYDVLKRGYDEYLFKVVDYTYIAASVLTKYRSPTGMLLLKKDDNGNTNDGNMYHVAVSGKTRNLPPIDWIIRVYVPKGMKAAQYGDRKYFPTVYGYRIEGEDKE